MPCEEQHELRAYTQVALLGGGLMNINADLSSATHELHFAPWPGAFAPRAPEPGPCLRAA